MFSTYSHVASEWIGLDWIGIIVRLRECICFCVIVVVALAMQLNGGIEDG